MMTEQFKQLKSDDADWWRGAVIYQIYPRSFQDDNGDGIGDLAGITRRLPHVARLGVDAIWLSPFFVSPMKDYGYDVSDYCDVDPMFGTLDDFDRLIESAHTLGLRVMIDQVMSHTSDKHPWFQECISSHQNPKHDWYVWADAKPDGSPPNNWLSIFGGSAWQWHPARRQYYLHNFLPEQPDLNMHNTQVQDAILNVSRFWLDRGVDGFRLDTVNFFFHDQQLRDNPALPLEERISSIAPNVNPYTFQQHEYDKNQPENLDFLVRLRDLMNEYPNIGAVGEVGDDQRGMEIMGEYTAGNSRMHMCYAFDFLSGDELSAERIVNVLSRFDRVASDGWGCWAFSNHDVERHTSRWSLDEQAQRCYTTLIMCLRGSVCLYQGEELGLTEADIAFEDLQDPYGIAFWPVFKGRDGCRTPMPWSERHGNDDFSAAKPWLPLPSEHRVRAVDVQFYDDNSLLAHYQRSIALRRQHTALAKGECTALQAQGQVLQFFRKDAQSELLCLFNLSSNSVEFTLPKGTWSSVLDKDAHLAPHTTVAKTITLAPWQALVAKELVHG